MPEDQEPATPEEDVVEDGDHKVPADLLDLFVALEAQKAGLIS